MSSPSDYRKANVATTKEWEREMVLEKAAYHMDLLGYGQDALLLRRLRLGREVVLKDLIDDLGIPDETKDAIDDMAQLEACNDEDAEFDEGEEGEAFSDS